MQNAADSFPQERFYSSLQNVAEFTVKRRPDEKLRDQKKVAGKHAYLGAKVGRMSGNRLETPNTTTMLLFLTSTLLLQWRKLSGKMVKNGEK